MDYNQNIFLAFHLLFTFSQRKSKYIWYKLFEFFDCRPLSSEFFLRFQVIKMNPVSSLIMRPLNKKATHKYM